MGHGAGYERYITSPEWGQVRVRYFAEFGTRCRAVGCGAPAEHVHHHTYSRFGREELTDLVGLCEAHHEAVHRLHRGKHGRLSLSRATEQITGLVLIRSRPSGRKGPADRSRTKVSDLEVRHARFPPLAPCSCRTCKARK